jgi:hypothetical protein
VFEGTFEIGQCLKEPLTIDHYNYCKRFSIVEFDNRVIVANRKGVPQENWVVDFVRLF